MTKHEIEESINRGQCFLDIDVEDSGIRITLTGPDFSVVSVEEHPWPDGIPNIVEIWEDIRATYRNLFNDVESQYNQKLRCLSGLCVCNMLTSEWARIVPHNAYGHNAYGNRIGQFRYTLSEMGVLLIDPLRNLKPGIPFLSPQERKDYFTAQAVQKSSHD